MRFVLLCLCAYLLVVRAPVYVVASAGLLAISPMLGIALGGTSLGLRWWTTRKDAESRGSSSDLFRDLASRMGSGSTLRMALVETKSVLVTETAKRRAIVGQDATRIAAEMTDHLDTSGAEFAAALALSERVGAATSRTVEDLADRASADDARRRRQRVATAQARFSAVIVGVVPLVIAVGIVAARGIPEPGGAWIVGPMVVGAALMVTGTLVVLVGARRMSSVARSSADDADQVIALSSTALGVGAGLSFAEAAALAADHVDPRSSRRIRTSLRRAHARGPLVDTASDSNDPIGRMFRVGAQAEDTGAPLRSALEALVLEVHSELDTAAEERLAKLPVKLVIPLALLILPGFILLAVGPAVVSGLLRLSM